jgi:dimethylamine monooxygenase subunit A
VCQVKIAETLPREVVHLPFEQGPFGAGAFRLTMGLSGRPMAELIELDEKYIAEMALRRCLLADRRDEVFATAAPMEAAGMDALALIAGVLEQQFEPWFCREGEWLRNRLTGESWNLVRPPCDPLEQAGRLVQEDLCLLTVEEATPLLAAGVVCFPSGWRLRDKLGKPLAAVHAPVPGYQEQLARPVDRLLSRLKPGRLAVRLNWGVVAGNELHRPPTVTSVVEVSEANAGERLFLRVERQTLSALPRSGAVLFGIRVHCYPLHYIAERPGAAAKLAAAVRALPTRMRRYKEIYPFEQPLLEYLDSCRG